MTVERRLTKDEHYLKLAMVAASRSKDPSTKCGCVLVSEDNRIAAAGYNGPLPGMPDTPETLEKRPDKYHWCEHAERNAVHCLTGKLPNGTAYVTGPPCSDCARSLIMAGVKRVVIPRHHNMTDREKAPEWALSMSIARDMFSHAGVTYRRIAADQDHLIKCNRCGRRTVNRKIHKLEYRCIECYCKYHLPAPHLRYILALGDGTEGRPGMQPWNGAKGDGTWSVVFLRSQLTFLQWALAVDPVLARYERLAIVRGTLLHTPAPTIAKELGRPERFVHRVRRDWREGGLYRVLIGDPVSPARGFPLAFIEELPDLCDEAEDQQKQQKEENSK